MKSSAAPVSFLLAMSCVVAVAVSVAACEKSKGNEGTRKAAAGAKVDHSGSGGAHPTHGRPQLSLRMAMRELADTMAGVMGGLWMENWPVLADQARAIAEHSPVAPKDLARVKTILGGDMAAFVAQDKLVHDTAMQLSKIAQGGNVDAIMMQIVALQRGCVGCHTKFRKRIRPTP